MFFNRLSKKKHKATQNRNKAAFEALCKIGFSCAEARRMLIAGNNLRIKRLAEAAPVTAPTIYAAAYGKRNNADGQAALAGALGMDIQDLFPEMEHGQQGQ